MNKSVWLDGATDLNVKKIEAQANDARRCEGSELDQALRRP